MASRKSFPCGCASPPLGDERKGCSASGIPYKLFWKREKTFPDPDSRSSTSIAAGGKKKTEKKRLDISFWVGGGGKGNGSRCLDFTTKNGQLALQTGEKETFRFPTRKKEKKSVLGRIPKVSLKGMAECGLSPRSRPAGKERKKSPLSLKPGEIYSQERGGLARVGQKVLEDGGKQLFSYRGERRRGGKLRSNAKIPHP